MKVLKISILLTLLATIAAEESTTETEDIKDSSTPKLILKKSEPYDKASDEATFFSKFKNWIFPGNSVTPIPDSKAVAGHHSIPLYVAPPRPIHPNRPDCDPCNKEPWIPIATNYGQNTIIGFVPQSAVSTINAGPHQQYGIPQLPRENYGVPQVQNFAPPKPIAQNLILLPPAPVQNFVQPRPNQNYEIPPPPSQNYGPPQIGIPQPPNQNYGPPQIGISPPPSQTYGTPQLEISPPPLQIGPPLRLGPSIYGPPKPLPNKAYLPPRPNFHHPPPNLYGPPKQYIPPRFVPKPKPNGFGGNFNAPIGMKPPLPSSYVTNYGVPPTSQVPFVSYGAPTPTFGALPQPEPSDSYGAPVTGTNIQYALGVQSKEYLPPPPINNIAASSIKVEEFDDILEVPELPKLPLPLPNLNQYPMAPLRAPQNFLTEFHADGQESRHSEVVNNNHIQNTQIANSHPPNDYNSTPNNDVQIIPSIPVANYISSVEYPINLIQSPLVEVSVSPTEENKEVADTKYVSPPLKLSQNPIVVDANYDNYQSSSNHNASYTDFKNGEDKDVQPSFSNEVTEILVHPNDVNQLATTTIKIPEQRLVDYSNWSTVSTNFISTSMVPPTPGPSTWLSSTGVGQVIYTTTPKPKQIQIIIPYTKPTLKGRKVLPYSKEYENKLSLYTQPPTTESEWLKYSEAPTVKPEVINIKDFLKNEQDTHQENFLPYDILNFQKNIDDWTALEYSKTNFHEFKKITTSPHSLLTPHSPSSKEIPKNFFITKAYDKSTTPKFFDHEPAGSNQKENKLTSFDNFETNFIIEETTVPSTTTEDVISTTEVLETTNTAATEETKIGWNELSSQKEKVYVVTPEPLLRSTTSRSSIAFSHPPKIGGKTAKQVKDDYNDNLRLILSEWPHLINNLETTTNKSTSPHPLFGLMGITSYIAPKNATIQTYSGHSKVLLSNEKKQVITIVTPISVSKNESQMVTTTDSSKT